MNDEPSVPFNKGSSISFPSGNDILHFYSDYGTSGQILSNFVAFLFIVFFIFFLIILYLI